MKLNDILFKSKQVNKVRRQLKIIGVMSLLWLFSFCANAFQISVEFSADAIQLSPGRPPLMSKMYVSKNAVRTELNQQGYRIVDIAFPAKGKRILLYPDQKMYIEQKGLPGSRTWSGKSVKTPCDGVKNAKCKNMGTEKLNKRQVEKWQVERVINGKPFKSLHWIDVKRRIAIKEMFPDGSVSELKMLGNTTVNGRKLEQWESVFNHPSGQHRVSKQWYDPELKMVIREELPGGYLRELTNIQVKKQDRKLFSIPKGYKKVENIKASQNPAITNIKPAG